MKIGITGATGFVGRRVVEFLCRGEGIEATGGAAPSGWSPGAPGAEVRVFTRSAAAAEESLAAWIGRSSPVMNVVEWDYGAGPPPAGALAGLDAVLHLAGESVAAKRWSAMQKKKIRDSRVLPTRHLIEGLKEECDRPRVLVCASAIGYYGSRGDEEVGEDSPPGVDFLADVCQDWEAEARRAELHGLREVRVRIGIVLGPGGGALAAMLLPFKLCLGGPLGNGRQWMSWIHRDDLVRLLLHAATHQGVRGALNGTAPQPVRNREFCHTLGKVLRRPSALPAPRFGLRLLLGEFADVLLTGQKVLPLRTLQSGISFRYTELEPALRQVLGREVPAPARAVPQLHS